MSKTSYASEFARKGGLANARKYKGTGYFEDRGRMLSQYVKMKYGDNYFAAIRRGIKPSDHTPEELAELIKNTPVPTKKKKKK